MYFVKYGDEYLHDPRIIDYILFDLVLTSGENSCGYCDFTIYPNHPMYDKIRERDADKPLAVYDDDLLLFKGFIYELGKEFYLDGHVKCKGELDYLSESIVRPYSTYFRNYGTVAPCTVAEYFEWLINQHNKQVSNNKKFTIGINEGRSLVGSRPLYFENDQYPTTFDELQDVLLNNEAVGGYVRLRYENDIRYIDYLAEWTENNAQILDFGVNLTDYTQTDDSEEIKTFIVPTGARMCETEYWYDDGYYKTSDTKVDPEKEYYTLSEDGYYSVCHELKAFESGVTYYEYFEAYDESNCALTIKDVEDGTISGDYKKSGDKIYSHSMTNKYGWIGIAYPATDITTVSELIEKATTVLKGYISPKRTIEIKAIDMHLINPSIKTLKVGEYVRVRSVPHNLDGYFLCRSIDLDLSSPENSLYTLGTTFDTLTGEQNKRIKKLNAEINTKYEAVERLSSEAKKNAQIASSFASSVLAQQDEAICALYEMIVGE